ncbi:MAG TPA: alpha-L-fucosidase [Candidatus Dormibacteraeota bacterium]|nr:alpha-L-fucosidase [Candidatus Dormibacteraeota bacterium]
MESNRMTRRDWIAGTGTSLVAIAANPAPLAIAAPRAEAQAPTPSPQQPQPGDTDRERRMKWWHDARFGMFIHWGLYSILGRHEWVMENEGIPVREYESLAKRFHPAPNSPRAWARLAKQAGQKYMVMTTKHHEGFCNFDASKYTTYCAPKQGPGRDLVQEYVNAARAEGLRVGFYYSLMDWHHPDGARCATDEEARKRFVEYTHGLIRELLTKYGKIDVLWYDVSWPLDAKGWESEKMNQMVFQLQPDIIVNNRNGLPGDFSTPEQRIQAEKTGRAWEACMTLNDSWGYHRADDDWKNPRTVIRNLIACSRDGGNYLLNIGPKPDGSIPEESVRIMTEVGEWLGRNGAAIYTSEHCQPRRSNYASFTRKGNTLYMHVHFWPGDTVALAGLMTAVKSARLLASGNEVKFQQDRFRVRFTGLPQEAPDHPVTTIAIECESEPNQDTDLVRKQSPRESV